MALWRTGGGKKAQKTKRLGIRRRQREDIPVGHILLKIMRLRKSAKVLSERIKELDVLLKKAREEGDKELFHRHFRNRSAANRKFLKIIDKLGDYGIEFE